MPVCVGYHVGYINLDAVQTRVVVQANLSHIINYQFCFYPATCVRRQPRRAKDGFHRIAHTPTPTYSHITLFLRYQ